MARQLGIERVWRRVVDFGDPKSTGVGDSWGYKHVSVARVSLLDGGFAGRNGPARAVKPPRSSGKD